MNNTVYTNNFLPLDGENVTIEDIVSIALNQKEPTIGKEIFNKINKGQLILEDLINQGTPIYGVTTGFGEMVYITVNKKYETELQENLIRSHCAGIGNYFDKEESRAIMAARINTFCKGYSGVRPQLVDQLLVYLKKDIIPVIPQIGSLGASGDLAPLAHVAITLIGEGYVFGENLEKIPTEQALKARGITPIKLKFKEGLALINGTAAMTGVSSLLVHKIEKQILQAEIISGLALEALGASTGAFEKEGHDIARPHPGQVDCAANMRIILAGSSLTLSADGVVG